MTGQKRLFDPIQHPEWTPPHTEAWYSRLDSEIGEYKYPWKSQFDEPTAEMIYAETISAYLTARSRVLDVGCGHGEFTKQLASVGEVIGIDNREEFISTASKYFSDINTQFLVADIHHKLPFPDHYFDVVYTKKGPWLFKQDNSEGYRIIRPGGIALLFNHRLTDGGFRKLFPGLYFQIPDDWLHQVRLECERVLEESKLTKIDIQIIEETEYISTPEDVLIKKCFGQSQKMKEIVWRECFNDVEDIFYKNATPRGLKVTNYYSIVTGRAPEE